MRRDGEERDSWAGGVRWGKVKCAVRRGVEGAGRVEVWVERNKEEWGEVRRGAAGQ